jgi:hypothetical protein
MERRALRVHGGDGGTGTVLTIHAGFAQARRLRERLGRWLRTLHRRSWRLRGAVQRRMTIRWNGTPTSGAG